MKFIINLYSERLESSYLTLEETNIKIHELKLGKGNHLIKIMHSNVNTLFDFSKSRDYQILYFDSKNVFVGASYAINSGHGNFLIQTEAKWVLLIPIENKLNNSLLNNFVFLILVQGGKIACKNGILRTFNVVFPITRHTSLGTLFTTIRRMKAEKDFEIPISLRISFAKSVTTGKTENEITEIEWDIVYNDLCENLKQVNPILYASLFSNNSILWN
tara:strand:- start:13675 stop:14325 length:651 start_codon:yes stop_codon:yes gene_type:complete